MKSLVLASGLALVAATGAVAQKLPHSGAYVGTGFEAFGATNEQRAWGFSLQGGYVRQYRRLGVRLGASYFARSQDVYSFAQQGRSFSQRRAVGLNVELTYDVTTTRFRPYIIGGWGLYRTWGRSFESPYGSRSFDFVSPAMIGGLGFRYRIKGVELFVEGRIHAMTSSSDQASPFAPVTFGLKFD